jgi:hypothetical protein
MTQLLSVVAAGSAMALGAVMLLGGLGLVFSIATSVQPPAEYVAAAILIGVGAINVRAGLQFWKRQLRGLFASAVATATLAAYLVAIGDLGEPFIFHMLYLVLLAALASSGRSLRATAW